jgi:hypothetical protein
VQEYLSAQHVLYRGLVDRDLEASDLALALQPGWHGGPPLLVLVCRHYDLTDVQVTALRQFVADGGRLVLEHADTRINFAPIAEVLGPASEKITLWDWKNPPPLAPALCGSEGRLRGVRFTAFVGPALEPQRLVLHALNYNVSVVEANPGVVTPIENLTVRVPVPAAWKKVQATVYDPDSAAPVAVDCPVAEGTAQVRLPTLKVYQMVEVVAMGSAQGIFGRNFRARSESDG